MMNSSRSFPSASSAPARVSLKLAGLFAVSFAVFFLLFFAYDVFTSFGSGGTADRSVADQAPPIVIDPKIESDLAKVLSSDTAPNAEEVRDPFSDRGGLSGSIAGSSLSSAAQSSTAAPGSTAPGSTSGGTPASGTSGTGAPRPPVISAVEATKQRYATWLGRFGASGDVPLDPRVFAIEDLLPVGIVDGGNGQQEVMFYSEAVGKTLSFPLGTVFFDGWLTELRPEGVVFSSNDDKRTIRMRSWARSIKDVG